MPTVSHRLVTVKCLCSLSSPAGDHGFKKSFVHGHRGSAALPECTHRITGVSMHTHMVAYTNIHTCMCMYMCKCLCNHTHGQVYTHTCTLICMHACMPTYMHTHTYTCTQTRHMHTHAPMHARARTHEHMHTYTCNHTHARLNTCTSVHTHAVHSFLLCLFNLLHILLSLVLIRNGTQSTP